MTKTQTEQLAKNEADKNAEVAAMTVAEIEGLDWDARRIAARGYANKASLQANLLHPRVETFIATYEDRVLAVWGGKVKRLENARRAFKNACAGLTVEQATDKIKAILTSMNIRGARIDSSSMEVMRGDRDGATLYYRFNRTDEAVVNPDDAGHRAYRYGLTLEISTCGTSYSTARMALVHKIHGELLEAANEIEATMSRERVVSVYGAPEPTDPHELAGAGQTEEGQP